MANGTRYTPVVVGDRQNPIRILFEVTDIETAVRLSRSDEIARSPEIEEHAKDTRTAEIARDDGALAGSFHLEDICNSVSEVASAVMRSLKTLETKRTVLEFGVEIAAETGGLTALIVKGSGKANLKITAEW